MQHRLRLDVTQNFDIELSLKPSTSHLHRLPEQLPPTCPVPLQRHALTAMLDGDRAIRPGYAASSMCGLQPLDGRDGFTCRPWRTSSCAVESSQKYHRLRRYLPASTRITDHVLDQGIRYCVVSSVEWAGSLAFRLCTVHSFLYDTESITSLTPPCTRLSGGAPHQLTRRIFWPPSFAGLTISAQSGSPPAQHSQRSGGLEQRQQIKYMDDYCCRRNRKAGGPQYGPFMTTILAFIL